MEGVFGAAIGLMTVQEDAQSPGLTQLAGDFMSPADASIGQSFDAFTGILKNGWVITHSLQTQHCTIGR